MTEIIEEITVIEVTVEGDDTLVMEEVVERSFVETPSEEAVVIEELQIVDVAEEVTEETVIVECEQGPDGAGGVDGTGFPQFKFGPIAPTDTEVVDQAEISLHRAVHWKLAISDEVNNRHYYIEVASIHNGVSAQTTMGMAVGDKLLFSACVTVVGSMLQLTIENKDTDDIYINVVRMGTTI